MPLHFLVNYRFDYILFFCYQPSFRAILLSLSAVFSCYIIFVTSVQLLSIVEQNETCMPLANLSGRFLILLLQGICDLKSVVHFHKFL